MHEPLVTLAHRILAESDRLMAPPDVQFSEAIAAAAQQVGQVMSAPLDQSVGFSALNLAFSLTRGQPRRRHCLELCAWELLGFTAVPGPEHEPMRALDLVSLPFLVEFEPSKVFGPLFLQQVEVPVGQLIAQAQEEHLLPDDRHFGGFDALLTREDLHAWGPQRICEAFIAADAGEEGEAISALPLFLDPEIESGCTAVVSIALAASVFPGMTRLPAALAQGVGSLTAALLHQTLLRAGIPVSETRALTPTPLGQLLRRTSGPAAVELTTWIARARAMYSIESVALEGQGAGRAELRGKTPAGADLVLAPPFLYAEPLSVLDQFVRATCTAQGLSYSGAFVSAMPLSDLVH